MQPEIQDRAVHSPLVSIAMPAFNCAGTITRAVGSCLEQSYGNIEVVVVDDGSVDATPARLASIDDARLRVIRQSNGGLAMARNAAMRASSGEFVAWMDADDIMDRERITLQVAVLLRQPAVVLVSSDFAAFVDESADIDRSHIGFYYHAAGAAPGGVCSFYRERSEFTSDAGRALTVCSGRVYPQILWGNFVHPPTVMLRRRGIDVAGALDEALRNSCDYDFILRMARLGDFAYLDAPLLRYRYAEGQLSGSRNLALIKCETARILEKAIVQDSLVYRAHKRRIDRRIALSLIGAAKILMDEGRHAEALRLLLRSCRRNLVPTQVVKALLHAIPAQLRGRRSSSILPRSPGED